MRLVSALGPVFAGVLALAALASPGRAVELVSCTGDPALLGATAGGPSDDLGRAAVSAGGRFVVFASKASNLAPGDDNGRYDVYVRDLPSGTTRRVSTGIGGLDSDGDSSAPALGGDGRFVVFASGAANLVAGDTNARADIFLKDLEAGTLTRVSTSGGGAQATRDSAEPAVSADGRYVAFTSYATDLAGGEPDGFRDVFVKDLLTGQVACASARAGGAHGDYDSVAPAISADGRHVAFASSATNLVPGYTPVSPGIYVKDLQTGAVMPASTSGAGAANNGTAEAPAISPDGRFVAFASTATNLAAGCVNGGAGWSDIFVKDLQTGEVRCASVNAAGAPANGGSHRPSSPDGRHVLFESTATNLADGYAYARSHIFVKDLLTGTVTRASDDGGGNQALDDSSQAAMSADARFVAFVSLDHDLVAADRNGVADVFVKDLATGELTLASPRDATVTTAPAGNSTSTSSKFSVSRDGRLVAFWSRATDIVAGDTNGVADIFVRDRTGGTTVRANTAADGAEANAGAGEFAISAGGRHVAFTSFATNLVDGDTNGTQDVFVKDLATGAVARASTSSAGAQANGMCTTPGLSADGRSVSFTSLATNLVDGDTNGVGDIFVKDLQSGAIVRASTDGGGGQANSYSAHAAISAEGGHVAFKSLASNLVPGDTGAADVFVKDLRTGAVDRASTSSSGAQADGSSEAPTLSADGRFVAFQSTATNLVNHDTGGKGDVFVKDRLTGLTQRASTSGSGAQGIADSSAPSISDDGRYVVFESGATNLVADNVYALGNVFLKDLQTQEIARISAGRGAEEPGRSTIASISGDGRHVAFTSAAGNLASADGNHVDDVFHAAREADLRIGASGLATVLAGGQTSFWIEVENGGPCFPQETVVSVAVPEGTTFAGAWANRPGWSVTAPPVGGRGTILFTRATLPGDAHVLTVRLSIDTGVPEGSLITCTAHAASATEDPTPGNLASWTSTVLVAADLGVSLDAPASVVPGGDLATTLSVANLGPGDARDASLEVTLPAGAVFVALAQTSGPIFAISPAAGDRVTAAIASLAPGAAATFALVARADAGLPEGATLDTAAVVAGSGLEADASNNRVTATTTVTAAADLEALIDAPATVVAGSGIALGVTLANRGPHAARGVVLTTLLPAGVAVGSPQQVSGPAFSLAIAGQGVVAAIPTLAAGETASFVFRGAVGPGVAEGTVLRSTATAASDTLDPVPGGGDDPAAETRVEARADLSVSLAAPGTFTGCRGLAYTVTVVNNGPSDARQVSLAHEVPEGFAVASFAQTAGPPFALEAGGRTLTAAIAAAPAGTTASFSVGTDGNRTLADGGELVSTAALSTETAEDPSGSNRHRATATTAVAFANEAPLADAGGPYRVLAGGGVTLDGSGATDPDGGCGDAIVSWEWDLDDDGDYGDAAGPAAHLSGEQVRSLVCGGACSGGHLYPLGLRVTDGRGAQGFAGAAAEFVLPVFFDDFADGSPAGDPEWSVPSGRWTVVDGQFVAPEGGAGRALARLPAKVAAGVVETSMLLPATRYRVRPNGSVVFAWQDKTHYRYAGLTGKGVTIGQVGTLAGQAGGAWTCARPTTTGDWHPLRVEFGPDGRVSVFVDGEETPTVSHRFRKAVAGRIGLGADRSRSTFDPFTLWPAAALPWPVDRP